MNTLTGWARLVVDLLAYGVATRRLLLPLLLLVGLALVAVVAGVQLAAPVILYPML